MWSISVIDALLMASISMYTTLSSWHLCSDRTSKLQNHAITRTFKIWILKSLIWPWSLRGADILQKINSGVGCCDVSLPLKCIFTTIRNICISNFTHQQQLRKKIECNFLRILWWVRCMILGSVFVCWYICNLIGSDYNPETAERLILMF